MLSSVDASVPKIDARVEFWSGEGARWPRNSHRYIFAGCAVHATGRLIYRQDWSGTEPETILVHPLPARFDTATRRDELDWAVFLLVRYYPPSAEKHQKARLASEAASFPEPDEWQFAVALSRQISNDSVAAITRYNQVVDLLVSLLEQGVLRAALRPYFLGDPESLPSGTWYNEVYHAWFATCRVDVEKPFTGVPTRFGGHWIVFEAEPFNAWVASVKRFANDHRRAEPADATTGPTTDGAANAPGAGEPETEIPAESEDQVFKTGTNSVNSVSTEEMSSPNVAVKKPKRTAGAKAKYAWNDGPFEQKILSVMSTEPKPTSLHCLADAMLAWCLEQWEQEPGKTTMRIRIAEVLSQHNLYFR